MKLMKSYHFLRQSSKRYLRLHKIISKNHYLPPPYPLFNVAQPCNHVYQIWGLSSNPKQHFPTLREGERGSLRYFLDDCLKLKKFEKDTLLQLKVRNNDIYVYLLVSVDVSTLMMSMNKSIRIFTSIETFRHAPCDF